MLLAYLNDHNRNSNAIEHAQHIRVEAPPVSPEPDGSQQHFEVSFVRGSLQNIQRDLTSIHGVSRRLVQLADN